MTIDDSIPRTVFLDAGGVLVWPNWARVASTLRAHGVEVEAQQLADADALARFALDEARVIGGSSDQRRLVSFFDLVLTQAGVEPTAQTAAALAEIQEYHRVHNVWETVPDFVVPALQQLHATGHKLVVVSNANATLDRLFPRLGLDQYFDVILDSGVEGYEKPDRRIFEIALERSQSSPQTTVHVGDFYNIDVTGARAAGIAPILVDERDLYPDADCPRIRSIAELPAMLQRR